MIAKIKAGLVVLQRGRELIDAETWKTRQNVVNVLTGLGLAALALLKAFGVDLPLDDGDILAIATGLAVIVGLFNPYVTTATTQRIGLPPSGNDKAPPDDGHQVPGAGHDFIGV